MIHGGGCESFLLQVGFLGVDCVAWEGGSVCYALFKTTSYHILDKISIKDVAY